MIQPIRTPLIQRGDTVGVFQIESRAQMAMLPRLRPATFYDLVIEVAIVRPGPIQGDMVHPYLRRRQGREAVEYPSDELRQVLRKTLGVPLFQEQVMRIAIVAAGFTPAEADRLRRAMASFRNPGTIHSFRDKFIDGMTGRGYTRDFAERCFRQIEGFGEYGFPESHAASFAHLAYVSSWLKCHYPAVFACALLNSQPMGFYAPAQIVRDARDHGVEVRPVDVNDSQWDCTLEGFALRLGLRRIRGLKEVDAERVIAGRGGGCHEAPVTDTGADRAPCHGASGHETPGHETPGHAPAACTRGYRSPLDLWRRTGLPAATLTRLAGADAFNSMGLDRRQAAWAVQALSESGPLPLFEGEGEGRTGGGSDGGDRGGGRRDDGRAAGARRIPGHDSVRPEPALPAMTAGEHVAADYRSTGLSLKHHPVALLRHRLDERGVLPAKNLDGLNDGDRTVVAGIVLTRQRPGKGIVMFVTLEDETGTANLVVFPSIYENQRRDTLTARLMLCRGKVQKVDGVIHVIAEKVTSLNAWLEGLGTGGGEAVGDGVGGREAVGGSFVGRGRFFH